MQLRLLRFLQEMTFTPVGSDNPVKVDVRVIAATNVDLKEKVRQGQFREDLYYRLKVVEINLPPLRERRQCLPLLINHFLILFCEKHDRRIHSVSDSAMEILLNYSWPGNVRELRHVIERGCVLCDGSNLLLEHLPDDLVQRGLLSAEAADLSALQLGQQQHSSEPTASAKNSPIDERRALLDALHQSNGNKSRAAKLLTSIAPPCIAACADSVSATTAKTVALIVAKGVAMCCGATVAPHFFCESSVLPACPRSSKKTFLV